jgi:tRNA(Glu) U13 pseudouridine synthase TruD
MMPSIKVGKLLARRLWSTAVKVALRAPSHSCSPLEKQAKKAFEKGDLEGALEHMPKYCHDERVLLQGLLAGKSDLEALMGMPHVKLFKLAYWSRLWNLMASERVRLYSLKHAVAGDLVLAERRAGGVEGGVEGGGGGGGGEAKGGGSGGGARGSGEEGVGGEGGRPLSSKEEKHVPMCPSYLSGFTNKLGENVWRFGGHAGGEGDGLVGRDTAPDIHVVTPEEERDRAFSIFEVVLPVVDSDVRCVLPTNGVGKFVKRLVKAEGMADVLKNGDNATQRCGFRSLVVRPQELDYKLIGYTDRDSDITPSVVSVVFKQAVGAVEGVQEGAAGASQKESGGVGCEEEGKRLGRWRALVMSFTLPPSSYATMMAREVLCPHPSAQPRMHARQHVQARRTTARAHSYAHTRTRTRTRTRLVRTRTRAHAHTLR